MLRCCRRTVMTRCPINLADAPAQYKPTASSIGPAVLKRPAKNTLLISILGGLGLCFSTLVVADDNVDSDVTGSALSLNSEIFLPEGLWPAQPLIEAPSVAVSPPEPLTPPPLEPVNLMLDWFLSPQHAVILVAHEKGFFQDQRLEVNWQIPGDPSLPAKLLAAEDIDLALGRQTQLHLAVHDGAPLIRIASLIKTPLNAIIALNNDEDTDIDTLGSRPLGFSTQEGEQLILPLLMSETVRQSENYPEPHDVHFETVETIIDGNLEVVADGFYHTLPSRLASQGKSATVIRYDALSIPHYDGLIVMANRNNVGQRMATWVRFVIALEEAAHWIIENPEQALTKITTAYPRLENNLTEEYWHDLLRRMSLTPAAVDVRRYQAMETFLQKHGITDAILPVEQLATDLHQSP